MSDHRPDPRLLTGQELGVIRHLGVHAGAGGQVVLHYWQREAAAGGVKRGFVEMWFRQAPGQGMVGPYYSLTDRGRRLAAALLTRPQPRWRPISPADRKPPRPEGPAPIKETIDASARLRPEDGPSVPGRHRDHPDASGDRDRDDG